MANKKEKQSKNQLKKQTKLVQKNTGQSKQTPSPKPSQLPSPSPKPNKLPSSIPQTGKVPFEKKWSFSFRFFRQVDNFFLKFLKLEFIRH